MAAQLLDSHVHLLDPVGLTYPWLGELTIGQERCDAASFAAGAPPVTGAIVVEAGVAPGEASREVSWVRAQAASHPWIRGIVASAPVDQPAALETVLGAYRADDLVVGVRRNLQDEPSGFLRDRALRAGMRRLGESGLPFDACVRSGQLTELVFRNAAKPWSMNAIHDIDALSIAIPYCHVVVPDGEMASLLSRSGTGPRYGTKIISRLSELPDVLPELTEQARNAPGDRTGWDWAGQWDGCCLDWKDLPVSRFQQAFQSLDQLIADHQA